MNNARIWKLIKEKILVVFTVPLYSPKLDKIENIFGRNKNIVSLKILI